MSKSCGAKDAGRDGPGPTLPSPCGLQSGLHPAKTRPILFEVLRDSSYPKPVIASFKDSDTRILFETGKNRRWANIGKVAIRKLDQIEASHQLSDLKIPPGNRLEALTGERAGQHGIRVNDQYRICFIWKADGAHDVEITDYH